MSTPKTFQYFTFHSFTMSNQTKVPNKVLRAAQKTVNFWETEIEQIQKLPVYAGKGKTPPGQISQGNLAIQIARLKRAAQKVVCGAAFALLGLTSQAQITTQTANAPVSAGQKRSVMQSGTCSITSYRFQSGDFVYPVYVSTGGKAFIIKVAKSGRVYLSYPKSIQFVAGEWLAYKVD